LEGAIANDVDVATAGQVFDMLRGFAAYGFCKSHAAAFALLTYQSAWLRLYHPAEFYAALLNNQPMGFYSPEVVVNEAKRRGVPVLPVDVNQSRARCTVEASAELKVLSAESEDSPVGGVSDQGLTSSQSTDDMVGGTAAGVIYHAPTALCGRDSSHPCSALSTQHLALRLGLRYVRGLGPTTLARLDAERACGPYRSLADFCRRTGLARAPIENLIAIGAFDSFGLARRELLWQLGLIYRPPGPQAALPLPTEQDMVALPPMTTAEELLADYAVSGLSPHYHPIGLVRPRLPPGVAPSTRLGQLRSGIHARVAGMIVCRQRPPTARGFVFLTLEDEHGLMNVIVRPGVYARDRRTINGEGLVLVDGAVQHQQGVLNLMARQVQPLVPAAALPVARSHDYA
jgi:error-prone DNA polymerase